MDARYRRRQLVIPVALVVSIAGAVVTAVATTAGCGDDKPKIDAGLYDATPDTPVA